MSLYDTINRPVFSLSLSRSLARSVFFRRDCYATHLRAVRFRPRRRRARISAAVSRGRHASHAAVSATLVAALPIFSGRENKPRDVSRKVRAGKQRRMSRRFLENGARSVDKARSRPPPVRFTGGLFLSAGFSRQSRSLQRSRASISFRARSTSEKNEPRAIFKNTRTRFFPSLPPPALSSLPPRAPRVRNQFGEFQRATRTLM